MEVVYKESIVERLLAVSRDAGERDVDIDYVLLEEFEMIKLCEFIRTFISKEIKHPETPKMFAGMEIRLK